MTKPDLALVEEFLNSEKINIINTRAFKRDPTHFIVSVGSVDRPDRNVTFKNITFELQYGEFSPYLRKVNSYLEMAKSFV